jgi:hypothetical protein
MLTPLELRVVKEHKVWGFVAYLQGAFLDFPWLEKQVSEEKYPSKEKVSEVLHRMNFRRIEFNVVYSDPKLDELNPLEIEQEAWKLLSPKVKGYVQRFRKFADSYSPVSVNAETKQQFLSLVNEGRDLVLKWNIISRSYAPKYEIALYGVTEPLSKLSDERMEDVRSLIRDLSTKSS